MSYQVLARKWRPQTFSELVGQQHVVDAITNALENNKLHHAYLFTGTRGVGKTTIARIFSKSLNCEQGQSANPCGECDTCKDISDGRYVDLLEIDAASRTKVEDTRELLDNVQYRPTRGKYKVYLIDEVHMLSKHSFNALLKTLEEPPEHVKFLLATTDPQKLPVTVLSRCLQFSLRALTKEQIQAHLTHILEQEKVPFEIPALVQLAKAAQGSIRDSLSLTDQAIAQGNNQVSLAVVANMLGLLNKNQIIKLLKFICERNKVDAINQLDEIVSQSPDYFQILSQLLALLHQVALTQIVPEVCKLEGDSAKGIYTLANSLSAEHIQMLYQIGINGKRDLPHAPDARSGLQMAVLRMLAFSPMQKIDLDVDALIAQDPNLPSFEALGDTSPTTSVAKLEKVVHPAPAKPEQDTNKNTPQLAKNTEVPINQTPTVETSSTNPEFAELSTEHDLENKSKKELERQPERESEIQLEEEPESKDAYLATPVESEHESAKSNQHAKTANIPEPPVHGAAPASEHEDKASYEDMTSFMGEQPPFPDEEPPMFDDMFAQEYDIASEPSNHQSDDFQNTHQSAEDNTFQSQASGGQESDENISQTMALLKVKKELANFTNEKQEEAAAAKKPEGEAETAKAVEQTHVYQLGHNFERKDLSFTAYLVDQSKLTQAAQIDDWSAFIDSTPAQGMPRQLLIHANCQALDNPLHLLLSSEHKHICEEDTVTRLEHCLSVYFEQKISINISFGETQNTPFHIQSRIIEMRQEFAEAVVNTDTSIQELIKVFDARVVEDSIEAR